VTEAGAPAATPLLRNSATLPPELASVGQARRLVREHLATAERPEWIDAAELACSELVTNAILHAHTDVLLTLVTSSDHLRVEVRDRNPTLPVQRNYSAQATTGRGMTLVAAMTDEHGVDDAGPSGKTVFFVIRGSVREQSEQELLAAWDDASRDLDEVRADVDSTGGTRVHLLGLPPTLWLAARQHHDALLRELVLYLAEHPDDADRVDVAAADAARTLVSSAVLAAVEHSQRIGTARRILPEEHPSPLAAVPDPFDLDLHIPADLGPAFALMQDTLDAAERLAERGQLLTRPGLPEIVAVRDWACEQVTAQLAGVNASRWPGTDQERFTDAAPRRDDGPDDEVWDVTAVRDADRGVVAADDTNRILAISRPLADALGWKVHDLVGRRVVTLIPPHLREAHVAGFTRALTTGEHHVLDVPLTLPVLRADGTEVQASFLVQRPPSTRGRTMYLAWIEPLPGH
jgi:PAS domain S-box-containing protein